MATTITFGTSTLTPISVEGYDSASPVNNIVHEILGRSNPDVTLRPAGLRTGTLTLHFTNETQSRTAENLARTAGVGILISTERTTLGMTFVVGNGTVTRRLTEYGSWVVTFPYQEVQTT